MNRIQYPTGGTEYYTFEENTYEGANSETSGSTQSYSRNVCLYNKYEYDEFPDYAATDTLHFTLTQSARIAINGYLENYGEYGYEDYELTDYILRIRPLNSSTTTKVWSLPNDVFDESHDFVSYGTTLAAGTLGRPLQNQRMCPSMSFRMHSAMIPLLPHRYIWLRLMLLLLIG